MKVALDLLSLSVKGRGVGARHSGEKQMSETISDIQIQSVLHQMRALAQSSHFANGESSTTTRPIAEAHPITEQKPADTLNFGAALKDSLRAVNRLQQDSKQLQTRFELGDADVSLPQVMVAMNKSSLAFDAVNQVRNRLLTAYQEVMRMSV